MKQLVEIAVVKVVGVQRVVQQQLPVQPVVRLLVAVRQIDVVKRSRHALDDLMHLLVGLHEFSLHLIEEINDLVHLVLHSEILFLPVLQLRIDLALHTGDPPSRSGVRVRQHLIRFLVSVRDDLVAPDA